MNKLVLAAAALVVTATAASAQYMPYPNYGYAPVSAPMYAPPVQPYYPMQQMPQYPQYPQHFPQQRPQAPTPIVTPDAQRAMACMAATGGNYIACGVAAVGTELSRCANGIGVSGGCLSPNGLGRQVIENPAQAAENLRKSLKRRFGF